MEQKTNEIDETKIVEAVRYAVSNSFNLKQLSQLLVMGGGVDLDTLARIIRENRGTFHDDDESAQLVVVERPSEVQTTAGNWFGVKVAS